MHHPSVTHTRADDDCPWEVMPVHLDCASHGYAHRTQSPAYAATPDNEYAGARRQSDHERQFGKRAD